jgi:hypothetical protein
MKRTAEEQAFFEEKERRLKAGWLVTGNTYRVRAGLMGLGGFSYWDKGQCKGWLMPDADSFAKAQALVRGSGPA